METLVDVYALSQRVATPPQAARGPDARGARQFSDDAFDWAHAETPGPAHQNPFVSDHDDAVSVGQDDDQGRQERIVLMCGLRAEGGLNGLS